MTCKKVPESFIFASFSSLIQLNFQPMSLEKLIFHTNTLKKGFSQLSEMREDCE